MGWPHDAALLFAGGLFLFVADLRYSPAPWIKATQVPKSKNPSKQHNLPTCNSLDGY